MDIIRRIEKMSEALESLCAEVKELKLAASKVDAFGSGTEFSAANGFDTQVAMIAGYLVLSPAMAEDELLNTLLMCAMTVVRAEGAAVTIYDENKKMLVFRAAVGIAADRLVGSEVPVMNSQHGIAFRTRQVIASTPMYRVIDERMGQNYRNVLAAPLIVNDEAIGTLGAVNKISDDHFTPQDIEDYSSFALVAAHIIRQRYRESCLKQALGAEPIELPPEFSGMNIMPGDKDLLEIIDDVASIGRRSPELLSLCKKLTGAIASIAS